MNLKKYDLVIAGNYTKDTIVSLAGIRYVDGGGFNYGAQAAAMMGMNVAAVTRLAKNDFHVVENLKAIGVEVLVVYKKRMLFCIFSCTNSVRQFILSAWLLKLLIVGTVEVKISLNLARRPTINSATAAMIVVNKAAKTPQ